MGIALWWVVVGLRRLAVSFYWPTLHLFQYEGWEVEFEIGHDDDGKAKAVNVTGPGGKPCHGERSSRRRPERGSSKPTQRNRAKPKEAFWHAVLADDVKAALKEKNIRTGTGTIDVSCDDVRVKLGTNDYASVAHVGAVIAEGTFSCGEDGVAKFSWTHCIHCPDGGDWAVDLEKVGLLPEALSLADGELDGGAEKSLLSTVILCHWIVIAVKKHFL